ncbi:mgpp2cl-1, protein phosphatase 2C-like protein 1 [Cryptotrichosporon argae]
MSASLNSPPQTTTPSSIASEDAGEMKRPGGLAESPNARSKSVTVADGVDTFGALNQHPKKPSHTLAGSFRVGVSEDRNKRCRRTMEDAHSFVYDYAGVRGQGYFAVFDGHAGKHAAEWCGQNFHEYLLDALITNPETAVPDLLNMTFHKVDARLSQLAERGQTHSGCTAVTAFLRLEHEDDKVHGFLNPNLVPRGLMQGKGEDELEAQTTLHHSIRRSSSGAGTGGGIGGAAAATGGQETGLRRKMSGKRIRDFVRNLTTSGSDRIDEEAIEDDAPSTVTSDGTRVEAIEPKSARGLKKVLYTANVGDARAVLWRQGCPTHAKRITDAGGFVMNNRVNGVLAVTRSLGDASMKEFVVGSPYTTETQLDDQDEFLIVACDGLWDVCEDQDAVDLIRSTQDPQDASKRLLEHAIGNYSTDNLSVMVVRFYHK